MVARNHYVFGDLNMKNQSLWWDICEESLSVESVSKYLFDSRAGGVDIFVGITREWTQDKHTQMLSYDCYVPMALKEMKALLDDAVEKWPIVKACILHRTGLVPSAHPSVIIGVATPHRKDAFEACRFLIDQLKIRVPIWKKETYADGSEEWVDPTGKHSPPL